MLTEIDLLPNVLKVWGGQDKLVFFPVCGYNCFSLTKVLLRTWPLFCSLKNSSSLQMFLYNQILVNF